MKMKFRFFLMTLIFALAFVACNDDDAPEKVYEGGVFVANEGAFGAGNGSITYYGADGVAEQNIFKNTVGEFAGDVIQSMLFSGDQAFLVIDGDNKIEVVNARTFIYNFCD
jgi:hypothetical protein